MIKIKPEEKDLDLVITGAEYGAGKRSGWMSSFILSCFDDKTGKFLEIGKMGTGIKEKTQEEVSTEDSENKPSATTFAELTKILHKDIIKENGKNVTIKPKLVISVTYQEIQRSPNYNSGFALRFPRFVCLRPDRKPDTASTLKEIEEDFTKQKRNWQYG